MGVADRSEKTVAAKTSLTFIIYITPQFTNKEMRENNGERNGIRPRTATIIERIKIYFINHKHNKFERTPATETKQKQRKRDRKNSA